MLKGVGEFVGTVTTIENVIVFVNFGELESVAVIAKLDVPLAVGVPVITPALESVSPAGRLPEDNAHVYGAVPPVAVTVTL